MQNLHLYKLLNAGYLIFRPVPQPYCSGKRRCSKRKFVNGEPPFLFVLLDTFARDGIINDVSQLPEQAQLSQRRYSQFLQLKPQTFYYESFILNIFSTISFVLLYYFASGQMH